MLNVSDEILRRYLLKVLMLNVSDEILRRYLLKVLMLNVSDEILKALPAEGANVECFGVTC